MGKMNVQMYSIVTRTETYNLEDGDPQPNTW